MAHAKRRFATSRKSLLAFYTSLALVVSFFLRLISYSEQQCNTAASAVRGSIGVSTERHSVTLQLKSLQVPAGPASISTSLRHGFTAVETSDTKGAVVLVHLGNATSMNGIPQQQSEQIVENVQQLRLFNPDIPLYLVLDPGFKFAASEVLALAAAGAVVVTTDTLPLTEAHLRWRQHSPHTNQTWRAGYWRYTSERFFYLASAAQQYKLSNIIHIEYDNMIYADLQPILPILEQHYRVGAAFDGPEKEPGVLRCVPGIMFFRTAADTELLAQCFSTNAKRAVMDMKMVGICRKQHPELILPLPIVRVPDYPEKVDPLYGTHVDDLNCVFDAAAYGTYAGGQDARWNKGKPNPGYIKKEAVVKPDKLALSWHKEGPGGLWVPYAGQLPLVNLHIHSKDLRRWRSNRSMQ